MKMTKNKATDCQLQIDGDLLPMANKSKADRTKKSNGFSLIEVMIGIVLISIALLGLAQLFTYSVMNNSRSDRMSNAVFLAQQQIEFLRSLTAAELNSNWAALSPLDELLDINQDGTVDFRRITQVQINGLFWDIRVMVFPADQSGVAADSLIQNPPKHKVRADICTAITR